MTEVQAPPLPFDGSRRLTGPNRHFAEPGVVLEPAPGVAVDEARLARWAANVRSMREALGWPDAPLVAEPHASGANLAFVAPVDRLLCATEVNEWAWSDACGESVGEAPGHPAIWDRGEATHTLAALARAQQNPVLTTLLAEAQRRGVPALLDDEILTLGSGAGGQDFPLTALPAPESIDWAARHAVPTALVTGSNGKTTTVRLIAALLRASGRRAGWSCTDGLFVEGEKLESGDYSGPVGARTVLRRRGIDAAVLETARGGILRRGLATERADVAVVTNVSADHFGEYGIHSLEDLIRAKLTLARAIDARGLLVLNADDVRLREAGLTLAAPVGWFSLDENAAFLRERAPTRPACLAREGHLWLHPQGIATDGIDLGDIAAMPLSVGGAAHYNIANLAAAALAGFALGIDLETIRATLASFGTDNADNRGRLERWEWRGVRVWIDYAHNPEGLGGLLDLAQTQRHGARLGISLGHAGNRLDEALRAVARTVARYRPDRVVLKDVDGYLRGRRAGEVAQVIGDALQAEGVPRQAIDFIPDEVDGVRTLLDWAQPGDLLVLPILGVKAREEILAILAGRKNA
jgi:UDP-N-acetylmuramyl tripeptide synthase